MPRLGVNVDHVATLRQARRTYEPDPVFAAVLCQMAGAQGIVAHLREDRRHMQERDIRLLKEVVQVKFNLEMAPTEEMVRFVLEMGPDQATLVPERREEITTEGGLNVEIQKDSLREVITALKRGGIEVSLFIDPEEIQIKASLEIGADAVELHTGRYANAQNIKEREKELKILKKSAEKAYGLGLKVHAGHGLTYLNVQPVASLPHLEELNIGHSIISRAVLVGLDRAVREMVSLIET